MTTQPTHWMTIREAALALGVSELTIRRRIKDGRLNHRLVNGKYYIDLHAAPRAINPGADGEPHVPDLGGQSVVEPSRPASLVIRTSSPEGPETTHPRERFDAQAPPDGPRVTLASSDPSSSPRLDLDGLLNEYARLAEAAGRARLLEDQLSQLATRHEELRDTLLSLTGRNGWLESKLEERESEIKLLSDTQARAPWWKRWFGA